MQGQSRNPQVSGCGQSLQVPEFCSHVQGSAMVKALLARDKENKAIRTYTHIQHILTPLALACCAATQSILDPFTPDLDAQEVDVLAWLNSDDEGDIHHPDIHTQQQQQQQQPETQAGACTTGLPPPPQADYNHPHPMAFCCSSKQQQQQAWAPWVTSFSLMMVPRPSTAPSCCTATCRTTSSSQQRCNLPLSASLLQAS